MNKLIFQILCALTLALSYVVVFSTGQSQAQGRSFGSVSTFATAGGRVGFFDQGTGIVYIYDENLKNCVFIGQMTELGKPIQSVQ